MEVIPETNPHPSHNGKQTYILDLPHLAKISVKDRH